MNQHARAERLLTRPFPSTPTRVRKRVGGGGTDDTDMAGPGDGTAGEGTTVNGHGATAPGNSTVFGSSRAAAGSTMPMAFGLTGVDTGAGMGAAQPAGAFVRLPAGPSALVDVAAESLEGISRLVDMSVACRYLCAQCLVGLLSS
jgi:anaphase-promoting complex subunit 6